MPIDGWPLPDLDSTKESSYDTVEGVPASFHCRVQSTTTNRAVIHANTDCKGYHMIFVAARTSKTEKKKTQKLIQSGRVAACAIAPKPLKCWALKVPLLAVSGISRTPEIM